MSAKITVSLAPGLLNLLDSLAKKWRTTRSGAVAELLRKAQQELLVRELEEGYAALAEPNRTDAEQFLGAQAEVVSKDGD